MLDACCNATSSFAVPNVGRAFQSTPPSRAYLRRNPQRSGRLGEVESVWLETVERGVLAGNTRIWKDWKMHADDEIGSCNEEAFYGHDRDMGEWEMGYWEDE